MMLRLSRKIFSGREQCVRRQGFTLIEVLVVVAIIGILAAILLPTMDKTRMRSKQVGCLNNLKQLAISAQMYAADNSGKLVENVPVNQSATSWIPGNMQSPADATNRALLAHGKLSLYADNPDVYHCPADPSQTQGVPHVRSYAMNSWMGSRLMDSYTREKGFRTFVRESETATVGASEIWMISDEHQATLDDGWFLVTMDDSRPFASFPATQHQRGYSLNFADGHAEVYKLRDPNTQSPEQQVHQRNADWIRLKQSTTTR